MAAKSALPMKNPAVSAAEIPAPAASATDGKMSRTEKIVVGTLIAGLGAAIVGAGFQKKVHLTVVDVGYGPEGARLSRKYEVDMNMSEECDRIRQKYVTAVEAALREAKPGATVGDLTPAQLAAIVAARKEFIPVPEQFVLNPRPLSPTDAVSELAPRPAEPVTTWSAPQLL